MRVWTVLPVLALSASVWAQDIGAWSYQLRPPFYAATMNDSGHVFGQWCDVDAGTCAYLLALSTACEDGESYPVLINSDVSAMTSTLVCRGRLESGKYRYALAQFDAVDGMVRKARRIGLAIPLEGDQFRVVRFSLDGAAATLTLMRAAAEKATASGQRRSSTRDQRL
ncbi:MAG: hypothetical protein ACK4MJ_02915 [Hylemonella sp.]